MIEIREAIKSKLLWISEIASVYHSIEPRTDINYPCVMFEVDKEVNTYNDTCNNLRTIDFEILLTQEINNVPIITWETSRSSALLLIEKVYNKIIEEFSKDYTLSGACDWLWINSQFWEAVHNDWKILFTRIVLSTKTTYFIK